MQLCKSILALGVSFGALVLDDDLGFVGKAQAIIGRPLTPGSVAGVARRSYRRAYRRDYYAGAGATSGTYYYGGGYSYPYQGYDNPYYQGYDFPFTYQNCLYYYRRWYYC